MGGVACIGGVSQSNWAGLLHVSTSAPPFLHCPHPELAFRGLGDIGAHYVSDDLWDRCVGAGVDVEDLAARFQPDTMAYEHPIVASNGDSDPTFLALCEPLAVLPHSLRGHLIESCRDP